MLFVMWVKWEVDKIDEAKKLWKEIKLVACHICCNFTVALYPDSTLLFQ